MEDLLKALEDKVITIIDAHGKLQDVLKSNQSELNELKEHNLRYEQENLKIKKRIEQLLESIDEAQSLIEDYSTEQNSTLYEII